MGVTNFSTTGGIKIEDIVFLNGTTDFNGKAAAIKLDADSDTYVEATTDDQVDWYIGGSLEFSFKSNNIELASGTKLSGQGSNEASFTPYGVPQALSGPGAINITTYRTNWTTTGVDAGTLVDGACIGQLKKVQMVVDGGDGTLTPTNLGDGLSTITFSNVGDYVVLKWDGTNWRIIDLGNEVAGTASTPVAA